MTFKLHVKNENDEIVVVAVEFTDTVEQVKRKLKKIHGLPVNSQNIIFNGKNLEDHRTLMSYHICKYTNFKLCAD